jgi:hypothetical protein
MAEPLTKTAQVRMVRQFSVCPDLAAALTWANVIQDAPAYVRKRPMNDDEWAFPLWQEDRVA